MPPASTRGRVTPIADRVGTNDEAVPVVFYGDYTLPASRLVFAALKQAESLAAGDVTVVYRHLVPAEPGCWPRRLADAAEVASEAGRAGPMHDALYVRAPRTERDVLAAAAVAGLDVVSFRAAWSRPEACAATVAHHRGLAARDGAARAPVVLLAGAPAAVPTDPKRLWAEVEAALGTAWVRAGAA